MAYKHFQLRQTAPNPNGQGYRDITEDQMSRNIDVVMEDLKNTYQCRAIPLLLETHMGDVKKVAACIATLGVDALYRFMKENRGEDQKMTLAIYNEIRDCITAQIERQQEMALAVALGIDAEMVAKGDVRIFTV
jgi:hypothetical protein